MNYTRALYKIIFVLTTSFCFVLGGFLPATAQETSNSNPFEVHDIAIDVTANNAVLARQQAIIQAQQKAWAKIITHLQAAGEEVSGLTEQDALTISSLVETVSVSNEQLSPTRYIADISVQFNENAVRNFAARQGYSIHIQAQARPILILPWFRDLHGRTMLWGDDNLWAQLWAQQAGRTTPPVRVPLGDIMDIRDFSPDTPLAYNDLKLQTLLGRYGLSQAIMMVASMETPERLSLILYETDAGVPIETSRHNVTIDAMTSASDDNALLQQALQVALQAMNGSQGQEQIGISEQQSQYAVSVRTSGLQDWIGIKKRLSRALGDSAIRIDRLSPSDVRLTVSFSGNIEYLRQQLAVYNLGLSESLAGDGMNPLYILSDNDTTNSFSYNQDRGRL